MSRSLTVGAVIAAGVGLAAAPALAMDPPATTWQTNGQVRAITFSRGIMYIGGLFSSVRPTGAPLGASSTVPRRNAAAINEATGKLLRWNPHPNGQVYSIVVRKKTAYLGGAFTAAGGAVRAHLAAVNTSAGGARAWNPHVNSTVNVIRIGPNGHMYIGGQFTRVAGARRTRIAAFRANGALGSWAPVLGQLSGFACPPRCHPVVFSIGFSATGAGVYIGGHFGTVNGVLRNEAAEVPAASGGSVMAFNPNIFAAANCPTCKTVETSRVYRIIPTPTRVYTCGGYWKVNGSQQSFNVSAFNPMTGALDPGFRGEDDGDTVGCMLRQGVLYVGGHFNVAGFGCTPNALANCATRHHVAAFDAATGHVLSWNPSANSVHGLLVISGDAHAVGFGGYFTRIGGVNAQGVALYRHLPTP